MFEANEIKRLIEAGLPCEYVEIVGDDGVHFSGIVVSSAFEGSWGSPASGGLCHAWCADGQRDPCLQLQTRHPAQWAEMQKELGA